MKPAMFGFLFKNEDKAKTTIKIDQEIYSPGKNADSLPGF